MRRMLVALIGGLCGALAALAVNQAGGPGHWKWSWIALAAGAGAVVAWFAQPSLTRSVSWEVTDAKGGPPLLSSVGEAALGVHGSRFPEAWVSRDAEDEIATSIEEGARWCVAAGPPLSGKSSVLSRAAVDRWPSRRVLVVTDPNPGLASAAVADAREWSRKGYGAVLWVENASILALGRLRAALATADSFPRLAVLVTTHEENCEGLWPEAAVIRVGPLSPGEQAAVRAAPELAQVVPALDAGEDILGRLLVARDKVMQILDPNGRDATRVAVLRAAVDWCALGVPLTKNDLKTLTPIYVGALERAGADAEKPVRVVLKELAKARPDPYRAWLSPGRDSIVRVHPLLPALTHPVETPPEGPNDKQILDWSVRTSSGSMPPSVWTRPSAPTSPPASKNCDGDTPPMPS